MKFLVFLMALKMLADADVKFIPSPNITTADIAIYNCSTSQTNLAIEWQMCLNGEIISSTNLQIKAMDVQTIDHTTNSSCLIIPGHALQFNNTPIICYASRYNSGSYTDEFRENATLLIQGKLNAVGDLRTQPDGPCCINITWSPPYTLSGVPILRYNINITQYDQLIVSNTTDGNTTEWKYCPVEYGEYNISVGAVNKVSEGNVSFISTETLQYNITGIELQSQELDDFQHWIFHVKISISNLSMMGNKVVQMECIDCECSFSVSSKNVSPIANDTLLATFNASNNSQLINENHHTFKLNKISDCDLNLSSKHNINISFHDVINVTFFSYSNPLKFKCYFVPGSVALGCYIHLSGGINNNITYINVTKNDSKYTSVEPGNYTVDVYDINSDGTMPLTVAYSTIISVTAGSDDNNGAIPIIVPVMVIIIAIALIAVIN